MPVHACIYGAVAALLAACATLAKPDTPCAIVEDAHERGGFHGTILVAEGDDIVCEAHFGLANDRTGEPIDADSVFEYASLTKPMLAVAALRMAERGELDLDKPVAAKLDGFPYPEVTPRHLMSHTSGIASHDTLYRAYAARVGPDERITNDDILRLLAEEAPPLAAPSGVAFLYSNVNSIVLSEYLEAVSGRSFAHIMRREVFIPASMTTARVLTDRYRSDAELPGNLTESYVRDDGEWVPVDRADPRRWGFVVMFHGTQGDGGVAGTARDLLAFDRALRSGGLLNDESLAEAVWPAELKGGGVVEGVGWWPSGYGLGWYTRPREGIQWHTGNWGGYRAGLFRQPQSERVVIYLQNRDSTDYTWIEPLLRAAFAP